MTPTALRKRNTESEADNEVETEAPSAAPPPPAPQGARALMAGGGAVFFLSLAAALSGGEPFHTWFYSFAWWSYILFVDGWVHRRKGESLLLSHPGRFLFYTGFSVGLWFFFELLNFRLNNWTYQGLPDVRSLRWAGYLVSFATVVPALMETADLLEVAGVPGGGSVKPLGWKKSVGKPMAAAGGVMLVLAMVWPRVAFPLVWPAFALLIEPLNERLGASSLLSDWREGSVRRLQILLLAGLLCGILWEACNAASGAQWVYNLPGLDHIKLFEMPLPGYLGFPLFAVEVFALSSLALHLWEKFPAPVRALSAAAWGGFALGMCGWVDRLTAGL